MFVDGYPGVYVQEVPSGVRTIIAASTSTLAVVGHFPRGPVGKPTKVTSWTDVARTFGGLDRRFAALYSLRDFFQQGGSYAWINRVAFEQPTVTLNSVEKAMVVEAVATGTGGNSLKVAISSNADGTFNLIVTGAGTAQAPMNNLSADPASSRFVERIVNAGATLGGSDVIKVRDTAFPPAATAAAISLSGGTGGGTPKAAVATVPSVPQPALTIQGLEGFTAGTTATATVNAGGGFDLALSGVAGSPLTGLKLDPNDANFVGTKVGALKKGTAPVAAVVLGRHPLRMPLDNSGANPATLAANNALPFSGAGQTGVVQPGVARADVTTQAGPKALTVTAANPGDWGNGLRVGFANGANGFDLIVNEYDGTEIVATETFRSLSTIATDAQFAEKVVNEGSALIRLGTVTGSPKESNAGKSVDELALADLTPLAGGGDGTLPGEPAWPGSAAGVFGGIDQGFQRFDAIVPELFNIMIIPEAPLMSDLGFDTYSRAGTYCAQALAFLLVDHPLANDDVDKIGGWDIAGRLGSDLARSAAICFPRLDEADPLGGRRKMQSSGAIAGLMARIDGQRGVWKAPAGLEASISGVVPTVTMTDKQQAGLNKAGINCLRVKPGAGTVEWGARTLAGSDILASEWKYVPVRRTALMIEQTLRDALGWVVFEPNDESLWAQIRLNVGAFMQSLFVQGAFQGTTPRDAYLVKCDGETTSQQDVNSGIVNILVGFAPLRPAEFVIVRLTQLAGRLAA
jgi:phage tail sheath protein FI